MLASKVRFCNYSLPKTLLFYWPYQLHQLILLLFIFFIDTVKLKIYGAYSIIIIFYYLTKT
jgi:hypothetical protein